MLVTVPPLIAAPALPWEFTFLYCNRDKTDISPKSLALHSSGATGGAELSGSVVLTASGAALPLTPPGRNTGIWGLDLVIIRIQILLHPVSVKLLCKKSVHFPAPPPIINNRKLGPAKSVGHTQGQVMW